MASSMLEMVVQGVGLLIVAIALAEVGIAVVSRLRRFSFEQSRYDVELENLEERLMTARVRRVDRERESQSWNGIRKFRVAKKVEEGGTFTCKENHPKGPASQPPVLA